MSVHDKYRLIRLSDQQQQITAAIEKAFGKPDELARRFCAF